MRFSWLLNIFLIFGLVFLVACGNGHTDQYASRITAPDYNSNFAPIAPTATSLPANISATSKTRGGIVRVMVSNVGNGRLDPFLSEPEDLKFQRIFQIPLVGGKGSGELTPAVAQDWRMSADGKVWTFTINEGFITDHDGNIITRDDVYFNFSSRIGVESKILLETGYYEPDDIVFANMVDNVVLGPANDQVSVIFNTAVTDFASRWSENAHNADPMIISESAMRARRGQFGFEAYERHPVGIGPMRLINFVHKGRYVFERFDDFFWHPENGYDEDRSVFYNILDLRVVPDPVTRLASTYSGYADVVEGNINIVDDMNTHRRVDIVWQKEIFYNWVVYFGCWSESLWCYNKEVRQAAEHALNQDAIVSKLYDSEYINFDSWAHVTPSTLGWGDNLRPRAYDVSRARELLKSVGFGGIDGGDGTDANGEQVSFTIYVWNNNELPRLPELAQMYQNFWHDRLGWEVDVVVVNADNVQQSWYNREYYGNVLMRPNTVRFDGGQITRDAFLSQDIAWRAIDNSKADPWASTTTPAVEMGLSDFNDKTRHQSYNKMYDYLHDQTYWGNGFNINVPWGIHSSKVSYSPWRMTPYFTAVWTLQRAK